MKRIFFTVCFLIIIFAFSGCDKGKTKIFDPFCRRIQSLVSPVELQEWAKPLICKEFEMDQVSKGGWPECLKKMGADGPTMCFKGKWENAKGEALIFFWGNGFQHWGIITGDEHFRIDNSDSGMHVEEWIPGVYFFIEM